MSEAYEKRYKVLSVALGGISGYFIERGNKVSSSIPDKRLVPYLGDLIEGGVALDKRPAFETNEDAAYAEVFNGPMLDIQLKSGYISKPFSTGPERWEGQKIGGFDYAALDIYLDRWRQLGARIGHRWGDEIQWEDGERTPIPSAGERYMTRGRIRTAQDERLSPPTLDV